MSDLRAVAIWGWVMVGGLALGMLVMAVGRYAPSNEFWGLYIVPIVFTTLGLICACRAEEKKS